MRLPTHFCVKNAVENEKSQIKSDFFVVRITGVEPA